MLLGERGHVKKLGLCSFGMDAVGWLWCHLLWLLNVDWSGCNSNRLDLVIRMSE